MIVARGAAVAIVVLAAGKSSRMAQCRAQKLLATFNGKPLIRRSVTTALNCDCTGVFVVTGHRHGEIAAAINDLPCQIIYNKDYQSGIASSLRIGVSAALKTRPEGIMITLADMPHLSSGHFRTLVAAFRETGARSIVRAVGRGSPGNPVIFPPNLYDGLQQLKGDLGARSLVRSGAVQVIDIEIGEAALLDVDTVEHLLAAGGMLPLS